MVKRGSVEDSGVERGQLLTEVEQLIQSQDCAIVSWGGGGLCLEARERERACVCVR